MENDIENEDVVIVYNENDEVNNSGYGIEENSSSESTKL